MVKPHQGEAKLVLIILTGVYFCIISYIQHIQHGHYGEKSCVQHCVLDVRFVTSPFVLLQCYQSW